MDFTALVEWLDSHAYELDSGSIDSGQVLSRLASADVLRIGVSRVWGGHGKTLADAVEALSMVAAHSMKAALVLWGQRAFIEYLLYSSNGSLREKLLPSLLDGKLAGTVGFSNAVRFLSGQGPLAMRSKLIRGGWRLNGDLRAVTHLRPRNFVIATAVDSDEGGNAFVVAVPCSCAGLRHSDDLSLTETQPGHLASLNFNDVKVGSEWIVHEDAQSFLRSVRPGLLGLQCGFSMGLAQRALQEVERLQKNRPVLLDALMLQRQRLGRDACELKSGLLDGRFRTDPLPLFKLKIALTQSATDALELERQALQAVSGEGRQSGFLRRWRESNFVATIIPSLAQLSSQLPNEATPEGSAMSGYRQANAGEQSLAE
jgi:alkylation response protein AidB-like acyl-CoA dehydrogenase